MVGLSGGVDSALAAWVLKAIGHPVIGLFMKNWEEDDNEEYCSSRQDWLDAASVADVLGIDLEAVNFAADYKERVFAEFLREYQAGRTPNPDVLCNAEIKFKAFLDHAMRLGAQWIATGHYARIRLEADAADRVAVDVAAEAVQGRYRLLKALDASKDQSYFLHRLSQAQLSRSLFPLGGLLKSQVRRAAQALALPNAAKKDSTGICFIGERPFRAFLQRYLPSQPGPICDPAGRVLGQHQGLAFYTLGQRKGLGIGGTRDPDETSNTIHQPWFVARKDVHTNTLWVVQGHNHAWLMSDQLQAGQLSWIDAAPEPGVSQAIGLAAKTRYRQSDAPLASLAFHDAPPLKSLQSPSSRQSAPGMQSPLWLRFQQAQWAVTPGQSAVLYRGEECLGGGVIESAVFTP